VTNHTMQPASINEALTTVSWRCLTRRKLALREKLYKLVLSTGFTFLFVLFWCSDRREWLVQFSSLIIHQSITNSINQIITICNLKVNLQYGGKKKEVKVKLSLCLTKYHVMKAVRFSETSVSFHMTTLRHNSKKLRLSS
jgi:hypothetical protein